MKTTIVITDFDIGYWNCVQNVASMDFRPDVQTCENLIRHYLTREKCLALIKNDGFRSEVLLPIVDTIFPHKTK